MNRIRFSRFPFFVVFLLFCATPGWTQTPSASPEPELFRADVPAWVLSVDWKPSALRVSSTGFISELKDIQVNIQSQEIYHHDVYRITAKNALEEGAQINLDFNPAYQKLVLHSLRRHRAGQALDQTDLSFKKVQREERLEQAMYDGRQSWLGFLKDVKVGDTIEMAYTVQGFNPVFDGRFCDTYDIQSASPRTQFFFRLIAPKDRPLAIRTRPRYPMAEEKGPSETIYSLILADLEPVPEDANLPVGCDPYAQIFVSEVPDWASFAQWAVKRYNFPESLPVTQKAQELVQGLTAPQARAAAILDFVQDQIRYLGIESDSNSFVPHQPQEVLKNVFGDCKDKSVLFCALARAVGLKAWPVLVSTWRGKLLSEDLPSPLLFDHAVVLLELEGQSLWLDPTRSFQGGALEKRSRDDFAYALVIRDDSRSLTSVETPPENQWAREDLFLVKDFKSPVRVVSKITGYAGAADELRSYFANETPEGIRSFYLETLHDHYGEVTFLKDPQGHDFRNEGRFEVTMEFQVEQFWQEKPKRKEFEAYPHLVGDYLYNPKKLTGRRLPYALAHPVTARQKMVYEMPEPWKLDNEDKTIHGPGFEVSSRLQIKGKRIILESQYHSTSDQVPVADWDRYLKELKNSRELIGWVFWKDF